MTNIQATVDKRVIDNANSVFHKMGLSMNDAIQLYLEQVSIQGKIPFPVDIPNAETIKAMQETDLETVTLEELSELWDNVEKTS